ncbi:hypothetical protein [Sinomicrobium sp.]
MTVVITKNNSEKVNEILADRLKKKKGMGNLAKHYGKLKRKIDGLEYQIAIRENED